MPGGKAGEAGSASCSAGGKMGHASDGTAPAAASSSSSAALAEAAACAACTAWARPKVDAISRADSSAVARESSSSFSKAAPTASCPITDAGSVPIEGDSAGCGIGAPASSLDESSAERVRPPAAERFAGLAGAGAPRVGEGGREACLGDGTDEGEGSPCGSPCAACAVSALLGEPGSAPTGPASWSMQATRSLPLPSILQTRAEPTARRAARAPVAVKGSEHGCAHSWSSPSPVEADHFLTLARSMPSRPSLAPTRCSRGVSGRTFSALKPCDHEATEKATAVCRLTSSLADGTTSL